MQFEKEGIVYSEQQVRDALPYLSLPATLLPEHLTEFGYVEHVEPPPPAPSLTDRRDSVCLAVDALRDAKLTAGFSYDFGGTDGVQTLQLRDMDDTTSWLTLRGTAHEFVQAGNPGQLLPIRTGENNTLLRAASEVVSIMGALALWGSQVKQASWTIKDQVRASTEPETIDINAGWPA